jgi:hypothetical protein
VPYADESSVLGRAGFIADAWSATSQPSLADIAGFLIDVSGEIDGAIAGAGYDTPATGAAATSLRGLCADCALVLALEATLPGGSGHEAARELLEAVRERCRAGMDALHAKTHPAITIIDASGAGTEASDFWIDNPDYGRLPREVEALLRRRDPNLDPEFVKGQPL